MASGSSAKHRYLGKTFLSKGSATQWVKEVERLLDREQYEDFRKTAHLTFLDIIFYTTSARRSKSRNHQKVKKSARSFARSF